MITISSVMFAVVFALFLESLERGAHNSMIDNMTRFHTGYIQVQDYRFESEPSLDNAFYYNDELSTSISGSESVEYTIPRIETFMLAAGADITRGAYMLGIDVEKEDRLNNIKDRLTEGRFFEPGDETVVVSEGLASRLELSVGDTLALLGQGRFGMTASNLYEISGLIRHPMRDMNNQLVYMSLPDAQWLLSAEEHITALLVTPDRVRDVERVAAELPSALQDDELVVRTWREMIPELVEALEFDEAQTQLMMLILYVVIGFGIFGTILTMTLERLREFGILLSVGMQRLKLAFVMFIETFFITILGVLAGFGLGIIPILYFHYNPIVLAGDMEELVAEWGIDPVMPAAIAPDIFLRQGVIIFVLTTIICLYPIIKILTLKVLEASKR